MKYLPLLLIVFLFSCGGDEPEPELTMGCIFDADNPKLSLTVPLIGAFEGEVVKTDICIDTAFYNDIKAGLPNSIV